MENRFSPALKIWYALREFETHDITSHSYRNRHGLKLSATKAREVSSSFVQAREYFNSASRADFTVRPLLLYYGVASLSRGATLFLAPEKRETSLRPSHGLETCDWGQELSCGLNAIGTLRVRMSKGLFHDLLVATNNMFYFRHNSSEVNCSLGAEIPPVGSEFGLQEITARIPAVSDQYVAWTRKSSSSIVPEELQFDKARGLYKITMPKREAEEIDGVFPSDHFPGRSVVEDGNKIIVELDSADRLFFAQRVGLWSIGDIVLYRSLQSKLYVTPLAACFILSFVLGMLCRYFPATWINSARTEKGDAFYPLATVLLDWIEEVFPSMVVDLLRSPYKFETT